jgi:hypothetical protein
VGQESWQWPGFQPNLKSFLLPEELEPSERRPSVSLWETPTNNAKVTPNVTLENYTSHKWWFPKMQGARPALPFTVLQVVPGGALRARLNDSSKLAASAERGGSNL